MALQLKKKLAAFPENLGSIASTHLVAQSSVTPVPGYLELSSGLCGYCLHLVPDMHVDKIFTLKKTTNKQNILLVQTLCSRVQRRAITKSWMCSWIFFDVSNLIPILFPYQASCNQHHHDRDCTEDDRSEPQAEAAAEGPGHCALWTSSLWVVCRSLLLCIEPKATGSD